MTKMLLDIDTTSVVDWIPNPFFVSLSKDGKWALSGGTDNKARIWDVTTGTLALTMVGHTNCVTAGVFSPTTSENMFATAANDGTARVWDLSTGKEVCRFSGHVHNMLGGIGFSPDGSKVVTAGCDNTVRVWDPQSGNQTLLVDCPISGGLGSSSVEFSHDGRHILTTGSSDGVARILDSSTGELLALLRGHEGQVFSAFYSQDDCLVVTCGIDESVCVWRRHRPERWWGVVCLWEFWLLVLTSLALAFSFVTDRKELGKVREPAGKRPVPPVRDQRPAPPEKDQWRP